MGEQTTISWTDATFNPWWGCTKVSPGCDHCYAEVFDKRIGGEHWGHGAARRTFSDKHWMEPMKWSRLAQKEGVMRKVFCASMADIFDEEAPPGELLKLWPLIDSTPNLIWQLLTKRPFGYRSKMPPHFLDHPRVWKGFTAEDQHHYDLRWRLMKDLPGIRWVSYEPALGPLTIFPDPHENDLPDWIVCGGESGNGFREMREEWAASLLDETRLPDVKFFMKQYSARTPALGKALIPGFMNVQEFPDAYRGVA